MENDPAATFGLLKSFCISDDRDLRASLTATTISFALGMVASVATLYFIGMTHLLL